MMWSLIYLLPKNLLSRFFGQLARWQWPKPIRHQLLLWFANRYRINMNEAEKSLAAYSTIQELFTRRLKAGVRPIASGVAVHPVDGQLTVSDFVRDGQLVQVKGWTYSLQQFLGERDIGTFQNGRQLTYYLCPTDYHRVHCPVDAEIVKINYIPGQLWPVNDWSVSHIRRLFARNERVVIWLRTAYGEVALVMVGATNVGQMSLSFDSELITNLGQPALIKNYDPGLRVAKGQELGVFNMGSTVILIYPATFPLDFSSQVPRAVRWGENQ